MRVILADDSELILVRLEQMLSIFPQAQLIGSYIDGIQTLNAMRKQKPDLAIIDIKMPWISGLDVLKEIRKEDKNMKIILLSFYSSDYYRQLASQLGADYFFSKSDEFEKLEIRVGEMVLDEAKERNHLSGRQL
jgi:DNA-binding NarL/FixJ family response regulator